MGTDDLHHKRKRQKEDGYDRSGANRRPKRERFLIVCEGEKTEPNYFRAFPVKTDVIDLDIQGEGKNTLSLVKEAVRLQEQAADRGTPYVQVWCVFDRDSFSKDQFNEAIALCERKRIRYAFTNEAFELWYLLHFAFVDTALSRDQYKDKLSEYLCQEYRKADPGIYALLAELGNQHLAIRWAKELRKFHFHRDGKHDPCMQNPSTTVHELVDILNQYLIDEE
ncbi:RloB domain-containing protein [Paenibacillus athensensis]|uniref:Abortive phage resistance protein n=1 Tax=Paenibacillus athensensis TaxID=1967502 RepID=A0A4Y8Q6F9_9BACL|nr:RloB family protein [Paenibacillus athensensis]MCD1259604.1 RloB domain-containing protein [Paenibacillus athensensis]